MIDYQVKTVASKTPTAAEYFNEEEHKSVCEDYEFEGEFEIKNGRDVGLDPVGPRCAG